MGKKCTSINHILVGPTLSYVISLYRDMKIRSSEIDMYFCLNFPLQIKSNGSLKSYKWRPSGRRKYRSPYMPFAKNNQTLVLYNLVKWGIRWIFQVYQNNFEFSKLKSNFRIYDNVYRRLLFSLSKRSQCKGRNIL